jgi:hypothetical protein
LHIIFHIYCKAIPRLNLRFLLNHLEELLTIYHQPRDTELVAPDNDAKLPETAVRIYGFNFFSTPSKLHASEKAKTREIEIFSADPRPAPAA